MNIAKGGTKTNPVKLTEQGLKTHHQLLTGVITFAAYQNKFVQYRADLGPIFDTEYFKGKNIFPSGGSFPNANHSVLMLLNYPTSASALRLKRSDFDELT